jgi:HEPN domain-containing protein
MLPEPPRPDDPREWLNRARSNLLHAKSRTPGVYFEDLCFDAQQAAEKALKAVLVQREIRFPYVHDLATLLTLIDQAGEETPPQVREAGRLTRFAVMARYPSVTEPVTEPEYQQSVAIAEAVVEWAAALLDRT